MPFIEMTGKRLMVIVNPEELSADELTAAGVTDDSIVRVNKQGDIEVRRKAGWDVVGGLLGEFDRRLTRETGLDWA
ncbi:MAG: hypothetical protein A2W31_17335 [Planctomycetes bacterium RBG_16_64_10]|nr:MAG: hypothetical protein A2W31_17335 [Planctomycetes bacterium RBG_16_64_10]